MGGQQVVMLIPEKPAELWHFRSYFKSELCLATRSSSSHERTRSLAGQSQHNGLSREQHEAVVAVLIRRRQAYRHNLHKRPVAVPWASVTPDGVRPA
jgi:hypothetical protein